MDTFRWANEIFGAADLGDARRTERLLKIGSLIADRPESTISRMMGNESALKGAHRFFGNEAFEAQGIIDSVVENTISQINKLKRVLLVQDTSHLNYDTHTSTKGLGHIGSTKDKSFQGIMMHWTLALNSEAEPIGLAHLKLWERGKNPRKKSVNEHQTKPIDKKESYKWIEAVNSVDGLVSQGVEVIWISDRESDIYDVIDSICSKNQGFVIRSNTNRVIGDEEKLLMERVRKAPVLGLNQIDIVDSKGKKSPHTVEIRSCRIQLQVQRRKGGAKSKHKCMDREINVVHVCSQDLQWTLLTSLPVKTLKQCHEVIWMYKQRWHIECIHKTLKSGFKIEEVMLNTAEKLKKAIAVLLPCSVRIYWMCHRQKFAPANPADEVLTLTECRILSVSNKKKRDYIPTIKEAWLWIAAMGGYRGTKNSAPPGQMTFWRGYVQLKNMATGAELAAAWN